MSIGVDIEKVDRFRKFSDKNDIFLKKIFTDRELAYCFNQANVAEHLAVRFCGKEAVIKALNGLAMPPFSWKEIEITNQSDGRPTVTVNGKTVPPLNIEISLSHTDEVAIAFVLI